MVRHISCAVLSVNIEHKRTSTESMQLCSLLMEFSAAVTVFTSSVCFSWSSFCQHTHICTHYTHIYTYNHIANIWNKGHWISFMLLWSDRITIQERSLCLWVFNNYTLSSGLRYKSHDVSVIFSIFLPLIWEECVNMAQEGLHSSDRSTQTTWLHEIRDMPSLLSLGNSITTSQQSYRFMCAEN